MQPEDIWPCKRESQLCINKAFSATLVEFMSMFCSKVVIVPQGMILDNRALMHDYASRICNLVH